MGQKQRTKESEPAQRRKELVEQALDQLLDGQEAREAFDSGELLLDLKQALIGRILDQEMALHLEQEDEAGNHRNGYNRKQVLTGSGSMPVETPRDRQGRFNPQLIGKHVRRLPGFDEKVLALYQRGLSMREIQAGVRALYGVEVSAELISKVTDRLHQDLAEWQARPLEAVYAIVYLDAVRVKRREDGQVSNSAAHLAIGVRCDGRREVLGMWLQGNEGARFWLGVLNDLKARGVQDILIAVVDGLKGFPQAIEAAFPQTTVQTCIVHLIRHSLRHASWKERKGLAAALKRIYRASDAAAAEAELAAFEASEWGRKYPSIARSWRASWGEVVPFLAYSEPVRRAIYTTNAIESLNSVVRRAVRQRGHFPSERAAMKLLYQVVTAATAKWKAPPAYWSQARVEFAIQFGDRFQMVER